MSESTTEWLEMLAESGVRARDQWRVAGLLSRDVTSSRRLRQPDVAWVLDKLATATTAGLPLMRALRMLARMRADDIVGVRCGELADAVAGGAGLSEAMGEHAQEWGPLVLAMVAAGEASGRLPEQLTRAAAAVESRVRLRRTMRRAASYPAFVLALTTVLISAILLVVVPRFADLYAGFGAELPLLTRLVISLSHAAPPVLAALAVGLLLLRLSWRRLRASAGLVARADGLLLGLPVVGRLYRMGVEARVASTLAAMLSSGVGVLEACGHAADVAGSPRYRAAMGQVRERLATGSGFSEAMAATGAFPEMLVQLAAVGEESATLPLLMERYAQAAVTDLEEASASLVTLIEPVLIVVVGIVVGFFVVALYMPILNLSQAASQAGG